MGSWYVVRPTKVALTSSISSHMTSFAPTPVAAPPTPITSAINLLHPLLSQRIEDMGRPTILAEIQTLNQDVPNPQLRYITILLEEGRLGRNFNCVMEQCTRAIQSNKASNEYIQAVFEHIHEQMQTGKLEEAVGIQEVKRLHRVVRNRAFNGTWEERNALEVILADAIQRLPVNQRRRY